MAMTDWTIISRSLRARLFSTITTSLTVAVAVALLLVLLMMRDSGQKAFRTGSGNMHLLVTADSSPLVSVLNSVFYAGAPRRPLTWARYNELRGQAPWSFFIPVQQGDGYRGLPVLATMPEFFSEFQPAAGTPWRFAQGNCFSGDFQIVLGARAARETGLKIGDKLYLSHGVSASANSTEAPPDEDHHADHAVEHEGEEHAHDEHDEHAEHGHDEHTHHEFPFTVVGLLEATGSAHDRALFVSLQSTWIVHAHDRRIAADHNAPKTTAVDLTEGDRLITGVYAALQTRPGSATPANLPQVFDMLRRDPTLMVAQPEQEIGKLFRIIGSVDQILLGMAAVVMVSSGIAIMLALYNSMEQRRRQIAVLRVLGASRGRIFGLIVTESGFLGVLGGLLGLGLALIGAQVVASIMHARLGLFISPTLPPQLLLGVFTATIALAAAAGLVPAFMAYRTSVARNLRPMA